MQELEFIAGAGQNFPGLDLPDKRLQAVQQDTILIEVNRDAAANLPEHVIQQSGVPVPGGQWMQLGAMFPADRLRREILMPLRTGVRDDDPRFRMKPADGMQRGVEKFRRVEMGDAESQQGRSFAGTLHVLRIWKLALSSKRNRILGVFFTTFSGFYDE